MKAERRRDTLAKGRESSELQPPLEFEAMDAVSSDPRLSLAWRPGAQAPPEAGSWTYSLGRTPVLAWGSPADPGAVCCSRRGLPQESIDPPWKLLGGGRWSRPQASESLSSPASVSLALRALKVIYGSSQSAAVIGWARSPCQPLGSPADPTRTASGQFKGT